MIDKKLTKDGFYCACDTVYFNTLAKALGNSINRNAPWAHMHFHIFDGTDTDRQWCLANGFTYTSEKTPKGYLATPEDKKAFWVNARFILLPDIYEDSARVMSLDADSLLVNPLSPEQFQQDMQTSWVTVSGKREQRSLGSAVGFAADSARHKLAKKLQHHLETARLEWYLDQIVMDELLEQNIFSEMDRRYSDFKMKEESFIWTGKGDRKNSDTFKEKQMQYTKTTKYVLDESKPHLGGNYSDSDPCTWCPSAWDYVIKKFNVKSVMDVGSGRGHAARWFARQGMAVTAIEGLIDNVENSIHPAQLHDLTQAPFLSKVDLVNCIEVVEHIEEEYLDNLLTTLTQGQLLLMTHAVPGQKGHHHVNCQPSEYWIDHLAARGFQLLEQDSQQVRELAGKDGGKHIARNGMLFAKK